MSFSNFEESRYLGTPIKLYLFRYGVSPGSFFAYTDHDDIFEFDSVLYQPIPISMGNISSSGTLDKSDLEIKTPFDTGLADLFLAYPPSSVITVSIRQGHVNDPDKEFLVAWSGRVLSSSKEGDESNFVCQPISTSLKRPGLRRNYQYPCGHVLYGPQCSADKALATVTTTVADIAGTTIRLPGGFTSLDQNSYINGMLEWTDAENNLQIRPILQLISPETYILGGIPVGLEIGQQVNMVLGCKRNMGDCLNLHNNIHNFGGQPWIPIKNPNRENNFY